MPILIDGLVNDKIPNKMPNIVSSDDKIEKNPKPSGMSKLTSDNVAKLASAKSENVRSVQPKTTRATMAVAFQNAASLTFGLLESGKGNSISTQG